MLGTKEGSPDSGGPADAHPKVQRRLRARLRVESDSRALHAPLVRAEDPHRFANLDLRWFWEDPLEMPASGAWSTLNAAGVLAVKRENPTWSQARIARHFKKSIPTIRSALAKAADLGAPRPPRLKAPAQFKIVDIREIADLVKNKTDGGMHQIEVARELNVNRTTVGRALQHWYRSRGLTPPDHRRRKPPQPSLHHDASDEAA